MAALTPQQRRERARIAADQRWHPDDPRVVDQRRDYRAAQLERHIRELVDAWPPLTAEQKSRLTLVLHGGGGDAP